MDRTVPLKESFHRTLIISNYSLALNLRISYHTFKTTLIKNKRRLLHFYIMARQVILSLHKLSILMLGKVSKYSVYKWKIYCCFTASTTHAPVSRDLNVFPFISFSANARTPSRFDLTDTDLSNSTPGDTHTHTFHTY